MVNASGLFATSAPSLRTRHSFLGGNFRCGFGSYGGVANKVIFCSASTGAETVSSGASPSQSRMPR